MPPPSSHPSAIELETVKRSSVRAGAVTLSAQFASLAIHLLGTVLLARLLSPADFGLMAMALAFTAFAGLFRDLGLSTATVQREQLSEAQTNALFWLNVASGAALSLLTVLIAPLVANFYGRPEVRGLLWALAPVFLLGGLGAQPGALLQRQMRFGRKVTAELAGAVAGLLVSVLAAWRGLGYWSLAAGAVAGAATTALLMLALSPLRLARPARSGGLREMLGFGGHVTAFEFINYFHRNLDQILIGRQLGAEMLGYYSRAYQLLMLPITNLRAPLTAVALPALSRLRREPASFRTYYLRITRVMAYASMPLVAGLFVLAPPLIRVVMGPGWDEVVPIFRALAMAALVQPVATLRGVVTLSTGRGADYLKLGIINAVGACIAFVVGLPYGPLGVALCYSAVNYLLLWPTLGVAFAGTEIRRRDFFRTIARPALASVATAALLMLPIVQQALPASALATLLIGAPAFALLWFGVLLLLGGRADLVDLLAMLKLLRRDRAGRKEQRA
ncbi:lipopolysaccharide biosynthesis protein [Rivibacter subsaxonicus]|uniref:O-antigen/teichoic acid export membrane protein n=1 Tax=Rivibacter subsaxonicus TaxID=457575 RepID=A0A4Q7VXC8_9BURK|nr:lipopolysaccharide biosynthesis protein [Rivibacter subsaxonicus]RZU01195.1 O-antigen/teichoic acid export membrane protein [Rivibacter subsaxonicus]